MSDITHEKGNTIDLVCLEAGTKLQITGVETLALADLGGGRARRTPPKGPDSFVLTYKICEM